METTYIYLNYYEGDYFYVGSHTWDGPVGVIDPNYGGSSSVAKHYGWIPIKIDILEVVSEERKLIAERYWIEKYAELYGIADVAFVAANYSRKYCLVWMTKFKQHGKLLNCHCNNASQATYARTKESFKKGTETRINSGAQLIAQKHATEEGHKKENMLKMVEVRKANNSYKLGAIKGTYKRMIKGPIFQVFKDKVLIFEGYGAQVRDFFQDKAAYDCCNKTKKKLIFQPEYGRYKEYVFKIKD